jgi:putative transcriptional regulator
MNPQRLSDGRDRSGCASMVAMIEGQTAGKLLISSPSMSDANFDRTVVFMIEHTDEGALGVVINRPAPIDVTDAVPQWAAFVGEPPVIFIGGPVAQGSVLALARAEKEEPTAEFTPVLGAVGVLDATLEPSELATPILEVRLFSGYSGWAPGQLERELEVGAWFVIDAEPDDPLSTQPENLWAVVLKRQEGREAMATQDPRRHWLN